MRKLSQFGDRRVPIGALFAVGVVVLGAFVAWKSPAQLPVIAYKLLLLNLAALVAHLIDRAFFRDSTLNDEIARALVFVGVVLALTLGL